MGNCALTAVAFVKISIENILAEYKMIAIVRITPTVTAMPGTRPAGLSPNYPSLTEVYLNYP